MQQIANRSPRSDSTGAKLSTATASGAAHSLKEGGGAESRRLHGSALVVLMFLFVLRVFAQLIQAEADLPFLPEFQAWDSGVVPYAALVIAQCMIIGTMIAVARRVWTNRLWARIRDFPLDEPGNPAAFGFPGRRETVLAKTDARPGDNR